MKITGIRLNISFVTMFAGVSALSVHIDQSKPCTQIYVTKNGKLHTFATCNSHFEKSRTTPQLADIQAEFEINQHIGF